MSAPGESVALVGPSPAAAAGLGSRRRAPSRHAAARGRRGLGSNIAVLAASQAVTWSMSLLWTLVVPRVLGPARMGILVSAWSATAILGVVLGLGTRNFLVRELVTSPRDGPSLLGTAVVLRICLFPLFLAAVVGYSRLAHFGSEMTSVLYLATGATFLTLLAEPMQAAFQAVERMEYLAYSEMLNKTVQSVGAIAIAIIGFGTVGLTACWLTVAGALVVLNAWWVRPHVGVALRTNAARMRSMVTASTAYWAFGVFYMVYLWIDSAMLGLMVRPEVVGWYGVPTKLFTTLMFVPVILSTAWLPRLVSAFEEGRGRLHTAARAPIELVIILSLPICVAVATTAGPVIRLLYGRSYGPAGPVLVILGLCLPPMYLNIMLNQVLVAAKRPMAWTWVMIGATVVNPLLNFVLIRACQSRLGNGAIGAAVSLLLTEILIVIVGTLIVGRQLVDVTSLHRLGRAGLAALAMWGAMRATSGLGLAVTGVAGATTFAIAAGTLRVATAQEAAMIRAATGRLLSAVALPRRGGG